ncbi:DEK C terminal domain containing protein [Nitzschia inconspicua]|uniref:DEK C terminal domain containing protein n=1 Tax=Nitzschia inconspicua TaxID=303405 RepID=A0A9K3KLU5_9STRA|nr:DEK C terminal domain containing protein [Nitzschia inconspicua]
MNTTMNTKVIIDFDLEDITLKKLSRLVCRKLGVAIEDLMPKKAFLKQYMEEALEKQNEDEEESLPDEAEIADAAMKLSKKVDLSKTSFTKFMKLLADELNIEDLTPTQLIIKGVYDKATEKEDFPSDKKIVRAAKKMATSSRIDLEAVTKSKFLMLLQKRMGSVDLNYKKELV